MSQERPVINLTKKAAPVDDLKKKEFKARIARVVTRGYIIDRLNVQLPEDVHGEWISDDPVAIAEAQALGFEIDKTYAVKNALHSNAAGEAKVGDVIFMTMPKWQKEIIDEAKLEERQRFHGIKGKGKPAEESQYEANIAKETPLINESKTTKGELTTLIEGS